VTHRERDCSARASERLADGENELLREMARTVLDGDVTLREVARSFTRFWSDY
jgi:hypothetical protein